LASKSRITPLRIATLAVAILCLLRFVGFAPLARLDVRAIDLRLIQRGVEPASPAVVVVAIDDRSLSALGRWPWPRSLIARLLRAISAAEPAVVGFDIVQSEATTAPVVGSLAERVEGVDDQTWERVREALAALDADDRMLAAAVRDSKRTVLGYFFDFDDPMPDRTRVPLSTYNGVQGSPSGVGELKVREARDAVGNLETLTTAAAATGFFNVFPDSADGVFRRIPATIRYRESAALPLSLAMVQRYRENAPAMIRFADYGAASVRLGTHEIPVAEDGQILLNFRGPRRTFVHVPAVDLLDGKVDAATLRGKLVLVGVTASAVADVRSTPFDPLFPGVEIHATALDNALRDDFLIQPKWTVLVELAAMILAALVLGLALRHARGLAAAAVALLATAGYAAGSQWLFLAQGIPLGLVYPVMTIGVIYSAISLQHYLVEVREKRKIRNAFALYLNPELARMVSENPEMLRLGGQKRDLTVLFSDIRGFTSISEGLEPESLVELLNVYLGEMTDVVFAHEGTLDKYVGDAIMAVWGAPVPHDDHAARACRASLEMVERLRKLKERFVATGWPPLEIGIGLHTGAMVAGNMGSERRLSYTVIGDNVNLGSRLEGLTKHYGATIIASEDTVRAAGTAIVAREIDVVRVKGKAVPVRIYDVLGHTADAGSVANLCAQFGLGLAAYRARRWAAALATFEAILTERPKDGPSILYAERCRAYLGTDPGPAWDPVTVMDTK
jgi:adenylate cyclase